MLRRLLFVVVGVAAAAMLAPTRAADGDLSGNWQLSAVNAGGESALCILKVETKDGKPTATVLFSPENVETKLTRLPRDRFAAFWSTVRQVRTVGTRRARWTSRSSAFAAPTRRSFSAAPAADRSAPCEADRHRQGKAR